MPKRMTQEEFELRVLEKLGPDFSNINQILNEILKEKSSTTIEKYLVTE